MLKHYLFVILFFSLSFACYSANNYVQAQKRGIYFWQIDTIPQISQLKKTELQNRIEQFTAQKDTSAVILSLIELADLDRWGGSFEEAFEKLWRAYTLAVESKNLELQVRIDRNLGIAYEVFNQDSLALFYMARSINNAKHLIKQSLMSEEELVHGYFSLSSIYRNNADFQTAFQYLDSCDYLKGQKQQETPYIDADRGYMYLQMGKLTLARDKLYKANRILTETNQRYQVVTLSFLGDLHLRLQNTDSALLYYQRSLEKMYEFDAHVEIKSDLMYKIADLYYNRGQLRKAYQFLLGSRMATDSIFNATSHTNSKLFEIKNRYQETIIHHSQTIKEQEAVIVQERLFRTRLIAVFITSVFALLLILLLLQYRSRLKKIKLQQMIEKQKNDSVLETKNKELTGFALKNLEKEKAVVELLEEIKSASPKTYSFLKNKHINSSNKMWEEFNLRFVELNSDFYEQLRTKHPDLTPTEEKHCALIKLNFDSKEMSQILNISLQSVHTSRYRIKRKIGLSSEDSLVDYITCL